MQFDRFEFYRGRADAKYGVWNNYRRQFQFGIKEDSPMLAQARLFSRIGKDAYKQQFRLKRIPDDMLDRIKPSPEKPGPRYGVWNAMKKEFQFGICETDPMVAEARLFYKIGDNARKWRFEIKVIPKDLISVVQNGRRKGA